MNSGFSQVKELLKPSEVVRFYIGEGKKKAGSYWYKSPFRSEKTESFCVNDKKGIHDFGDNKHYDIISFVTNLFQINNVAAVNRLIMDFNLPIDIYGSKPKIFYERDLKKFRQERQKKENEKALKKQYYENLYSVSCEKFKQWNNFINELKEKRNVIQDIDLHRLYSMREYYGWICDSILDMDYEELWENREKWEEICYER